MEETTITGAMVARYFLKGAVLSIVAGVLFTTVFSDDDDSHKLNSFGRGVCCMTLIAWPITIALGVVVGVAMIFTAVDDWLDLNGYSPLTWVFAWPVKLYGAVERRLFRRKVRRMIETGDTRIMDEDTGKFGKEQE